MNRALNQIVIEITGSNIHRARDATVRATLVLERDARGYWDNSLVEGFPQPGLYEQTFAGSDIDSFVRQLGNAVHDASLADELRLSVISALCKSQRKEVFVIFMRLLNETEDLKSLCENTDVLESVADFLEDRSIRQVNEEVVSGLRAKLRSLTFSDPGSEAARKRLIAAAEN